jgi:hypothetical protein
MPGYEVWVHHGEEVPENELVAEDVVTDEDRMDEMLNAICPKIEKDFEDPPYSRGSKVCWAPYSFRRGSAGAYDNIHSFFCDMIDGHQVKVCVLQ